MAVSSAFLNSMRMAVRRSSTTDLDAELTDIIEECRLDMVARGIITTMAQSESDERIKGAVRCYCRWKSSFSGDDSAANKEDYTELVDEMRRNEGYGWEASTDA